MWYSNTWVVLTHVCQLIHYFEDSILNIKYSKMFPKKIFEKNENENL
jgi:hypothetical protein